MILAMFIGWMFADLSLADAQTRTPIQEPDAEERIEPEGSRAFTLHVPELAGSMNVVLTWRARVDADRPMTGREFLKVAVNGASVGAMRDRLNPRLIDKPIRFRSHKNKLRYWYTEGAEGWLTPFAMDFTVPVPGWSQGSLEDAYAFKIDITDLIKPGAENTLTFKSLMKARYVQKYGSRYFQHARGEIVLKDVSIEFRNENTTLTAKSAQKLQGAESLDWDLKIAPSGDMTVRWYGQTAKIETFFAQGDGKWIGFADDAEKKEVSRPDPSTWKVYLQAPFYRIERTIHHAQSRIEISDRFLLEPNSDTAVVMPRIRISVTENTYGTIWLGGDNDPSLTDVNCPYNPTLFIPMDGAGLGLVLEDDVLRLQASFSYDAKAGSALVRSDEMVVSQKAGGEYTIRYTLYPACHNSYWDFINTVRKDWNISGTLPGTFWFTTPRNIILSNPESIRGYIRENNVAYVVFWENPDPKDYQLQAPYIVKGAAQLHPKAESVLRAFETDERNAIEKLHLIKPEVKALVYVHSHVCSILDPEQAVSLEDSLIVGQDGELVRRHAGDSRFFPLYFIYPSASNSYGKVFEQLIDHLLGLGADGIYWDEMSAATGDARYTYSEFDGFTADIDPEMQTINRLKGLVSLLSSDYKVAQVKRLIDREKVVHANSAPETIAQNLLPITRMVETTTSAARVKELHLTTPYSYTWAPFTMDQFLDRLFKGGLCFRPGKESPFIGRSYPVTPEYLGSGYMLGKNRIVTGVSGAYGWDEPWQATMMVYDVFGRIIEQRSLEGKGRREVAVPLNGLVILERLHRN
ncbi:MAG: hypothetical protein C4530_23575 [Desulfobacteraceae bacterium]|nr:MAG: hypothetical protein C4530_23575 [Desulfobacteraceae bacterium]